MKICVSIINYRTADLTISAVTSVLDDIGSHDVQIVIVDNDSCDGSAGKIEQWIGELKDERLTMKISDLNTGFSGGHNQVFDEVQDADIYLVLNSDAIVKSGFFDRVLQAMSDDPSIGLLAPQLKGADGVIQDSCFRFPSPISEFVRGAGTGLVTKVLSARRISIKHPPAESEIEWASFACIIVRGKMLREIGLMDDGYFLYYEDVEYCMRAASAGWRIKYLPCACAIHFRGGSGPLKALAAEKGRLPEYFWRSRTRYFRQAYGPLGPLVANLSWIAGRFVANLRILACRKVPLARQAEWRDIWIGVRNPLRNHWEL